MPKRKRVSDQTFKAVYVNTSIDTHLLLQASPLLFVSNFKDLIVMEHSKIFPEFGEIEIKSFQVKRRKNYYHLTQDMLLKTAFVGVDVWYVFVDVAEATSDNCNVEREKIDEGGFREMTKRVKFSRPMNEQLTRNGVSAVDIIRAEVQTTPLDEHAGDSLKSKKLKVTKSGNTSKERKTNEGESFFIDLLSARENNDLKSGNTTHRGGSGSNESVVVNEFSEVNHCEAASGCVATKSKKKKIKGVFRVNRSHALLRGHVPDTMENGATVFALDSETRGKGGTGLGNKRTADEEIKESQDTSKKNKSRKSDNVELKRKNKISVQTVVAHEAAMLNLNKLEASESKQKMSAQPSVVDPSFDLVKPQNCYESERIFLIGFELQSYCLEAEKMRLAGVDSFQPPHDKNPEVNEQIVHDTTKTRSYEKQLASEDNLSDIVPVEHQLVFNVPKTVVELGDDSVPYDKAADADRREQVSHTEKCTEDSIEVRNIDVPSSVDISSIGFDSASQEGENQNNPHQSQWLSEFGSMGPLFQMYSPPEECPDTRSVNVGQMLQKEPCLSANTRAEVVELGDDSVPYNNAVDADKREKVSHVEKCPEDSIEVRNLDVSSMVDTSSDWLDPILLGSDFQNDIHQSQLLSEIGSMPTGFDTQSFDIEQMLQTEPCLSAHNRAEPDLLLTNSNGDAEQGNVMSLPVGHCEQKMENPDECDNYSLDGSPLQKSITETQCDLKAKSTKDASEMDAQVSAAVPVNSQAETSSLITRSSELIDRTPPNRSAEVSGNALLLMANRELSSDSSDSEYGTNGSVTSNCSTDEDVSSSDDSEGDKDFNGGSARDRRHVDISAMKEIGIVKVLRCASWYKKSYEVASQTLKEDDENQDPVIILDSETD